MARATTTRQRLLTAGMGLFAERGFGATSVGDIEAAVGLQPRRGALYKHFANKHDLLECAVRDRLDAAASLARQVDQLDAGAVPSDASDLRGLVILLGRLFLDEMDDLEELTRVLEHDAPRVRDLTVAVKTDMVDLSYRAAGRLIAVLAPDTRDMEAMAIVVLGSLVALRRTAWTFGSPPLGVDDDRYLETWADATLAALRNPATGSSGTS